MPSSFISETASKYMIMEMFVVKKLFKVGFTITFKSPTWLKTSESAPTSGETITQVLNTSSMEAVDALID